MELILLEQALQITKLSPGAAIPSEVWDCAFCALTKTAEELSLVLPETIPLGSPHIEHGWRALQVGAQLDFNLVGVIAGISAALAAQNIPIFVLSTYHTDYILVKEHKLDKAVTALEEAGYTMVSSEFGMNEKTACGSFGD